ncbi:MAG: transposase [Selenomonadaceae bacterium]|nr:transposase [Selenomonadaceae bacterium]
MYIVGIDIAKRFHEATIIDKAGKVVVKRICFANSHAGFLKLTEAVKKLDAPVRHGSNRALLVAALCPFASSRADWHRKILLPCANCADSVSFFRHFRQIFYGTFGKLHHSRRNALHRCPNSCRPFEQSLARKVRA